MPRRKAAAIGSKDEGVPVFVNPARCDESGGWRCGWRSGGCLPAVRRLLRAPREGHRHVALAAQQPVVLEPAFAAAVGDRDDVIGFPSGTCGTPGAPAGAIAGRRLRPRPFAMRLDHVEPADLARAFVAPPDLLADVPRAAANLPLVHARVAAEGSPRRLHETAAPAAHRLAGLVALGLSPLLRRHHPGAPRAHGGSYRSEGIGALGGRGRRQRRRFTTKGTKRTKDERREDALGHPSARRLSRSLPRHSPSSNDNAKRARGSTHCSRIANPAVSPMRAICAGSYL